MKLLYRRFCRWCRRPRRKKPRNVRTSSARPSTKKKSLIPRRYIFLAMLLLVIIVFVHSFYRFDRRVLPMVLEAAELRFQAEINNVINDVIQEIIRESGITAADFVIWGEDGGVLSVNTVLVNDICNSAAQRISLRLNNMEPEVAIVPMGMAFGLDTLAQTGPRFSFTLAPIGNALVNYESSFTAVGINQIHFAVWLTVESVVRIINPVHSSEIVVVRNVSLVDTVISGTVPETYLNMDVPGFVRP